MVQMPTPPPQADHYGDQQHQHQQHQTHMGSMMGSYDGMWPQHQQQQQQQRQQQQHSSHSHHFAGQGNNRSHHRTPGPGQTNPLGPSPPNPFRYGLEGLSYQGSDMLQYAPDHGRGGAAAQFHSNQFFFDSDAASNSYAMDSSSGNSQGDMSWYDQLPQQHHHHSDHRSISHHDRHQQQQHQHQQYLTSASSSYGHDGNVSATMNGGMAPLNFEGSSHGFADMHNPHAMNSFGQFSMPEDMAMQALGSNFTQLGFDEASSSSSTSSHDAVDYGSMDRSRQRHAASAVPPPGYLGRGGSMYGQVQGNYGGSRVGTSTSGSHQSYYGEPSATIPHGPESYGSSASSSGLAFAPGGTFVNGRQRDATTSFDSTPDQKSIGTPVSTPQSSPIRGPQISSHQSSPQRMPSEFVLGHSPHRTAYLDPADQRTYAQHVSQPHASYLGALSGSDSKKSPSVNTTASVAAAAVSHTSAPGLSSNLGLGSGDPGRPPTMAYSDVLIGGMRKSSNPIEEEEERKDKRDGVASPNANGGRSSSGTSNNNNNNNNNHHHNNNNQNYSSSAIDHPSQKNITVAPATSSSGLTKPPMNNGNNCNSSTPESLAHDSPWAQKKKAELDETPQTRSVFKDFYKTFRSKEKESVEEAFAYAHEALASKDVPERIHWKIYLEMADLAKRENRFKDARDLYQLVNKTQPFAHQGWLEYSKMEEECGRLLHCRSILQEGLEYCNYAEQLLTKAIKHEERLGNLDNARALLSRLRTQNVEKAWRTILEGALLEARAGNIVVARKVFKYLMENVPWYGPIYFEATRFEEKNEEFERAIAIVEKGLKEIPRYGPLWFNAFRLHEKTEMEQAMRNVATSKTPPKPAPKEHMLRDEKDRLKYDLQNMFGVDEGSFHVDTVPCKLLQTRGALQRAMNCISKELVWKVHFEAAQVAERGGGPDALQRARHAYVQSVLRCPVNLRWKVWLAGARAELAHGNMDKARQLLDRALVDVPAKSRAQVLLECSRVEEYEGHVETARDVLLKARDETRHEWKVFLEAVMLELRNGHREDAIRAAEDALATHSGTGRLWAILVQLKHAIGPDSQRLVFREALKSCPKSGEVWCEGARLHMNPLSPYFDLETAFRYLEFAIQFTPQYGGSFLELMRWKLLRSNFGDDRAFPDFAHIEDENLFRQNMLRCDTSDIELRCVNADPNYGALWFHCKRGPFDTARQVLRTAKGLMIEELCKFRAVYREAIAESIHRKQDHAARQVARAKSRTTPALAGGEDRWLTERLESVPGADTYANFSTGLLSVNWLGEHVGLLIDRERRKFLFGSDQIVP